MLLSKQAVLGGLLAQLRDLPLQGPNGTLQRVDLSLLALGGTVLVKLYFFKFGPQVIQFQLLLLNFCLHCLEMQKKLLLNLYG